MLAIFIRHGQSTGNIGIPCHDLALLELTELGWRQSREMAARWMEKPSLIVTSPYLRTQQTAAPTIERFPEVPVQVWPIQEFTYLQPSRWNGSRSAERMPAIERYWAEADTEFCDGEGAESFATLLKRGGGDFESTRSHARKCPGLRLQSRSIHPGLAISRCGFQADRPGEDAEI